MPWPVRRRQRNVFYPDHYGWPKTPLASSRTRRGPHALQLVHLYADRGSPSFERAALRLVGRYLDEVSPTLAQLADVTATLAAKDPTAP